jgi:type VI secretion system protein ImpA
LLQFGDSTSPDARPDPRDPTKKISVPWQDIKTQALEGLEKSKDIRLLAYLGCASLRTDGLPAFADTLSVASQWLKAYWDDTYPRLDEKDATMRKTALENFADQAAVIDGLRRVPLVRSRQHGVFSFRDLEIVNGQLTPAASEPKPDEGRIKAAFAEMPTEAYEALSLGVSTAVDALKSITASMESGVGGEGRPDFDPLLTVLGRMGRAVAKERGVPSAADAASSTSAAAGESAAVAVGAIRTRQDAIRALDAVAAFFRANEPSSPIPLLTDRAKRLVSKDFLEVLADVAPDAVSQARAAGGLKDQ